MSTPDGSEHSSIHFKCYKSSHKPKNGCATDLDSMPSCSTSTASSSSMLRSISLSHHSLNISKAKRHNSHDDHENIEKFCAMAAESIVKQDKEAMEYFNIHTTPSSSLVASPSSTPRNISSDSSWEFPSPASVSEPFSRTPSPECSSLPLDYVFSSVTRPSVSRSRSVSPISPARTLLPGSANLNTPNVSSSGGKAASSTSVDLTSPSTSRDLSSSPSSIVSPKPSTSHDETLVPSSETHLDVSKGCKAKRKSTRNTDRSKKLSNSPT